MIKDPIKLDAVYIMNGIMNGTIQELHFNKTYRYMGNVIKRRYHSLLDFKYYITNQKESIENNLIVDTINQYLDELVVSKSLYERGVWID